MVCGVKEFFIHMKWMIWGAERGERQISRFLVQCYYVLWWGNAGAVGKHMRWCPSPMFGFGWVGNCKVREIFLEEIILKFTRNGMGREQTEKCSDRRNGLCGIPEEKGWCFQRQEKKKFSNPGIRGWERRIPRNKARDVSKSKITKVHGSQSKRFGLYPKTFESLYPGE